MTNLARAFEVTKIHHSGPAQVAALRGVSLDVAPGTLTLIMGPSGSGKSTLLSVLSGVTQPTEGEVELCGFRLSGLCESERVRLRRDRVGFVFQSYNLFPSLSALDNVGFPLRQRGRSWKEACEPAAYALRRVGLSARRNHRPAELSGGEKQRVAIARALVTAPALIVGDEVTAALDGFSAVQVLDLIRSYVTAATAAVLVTHGRRLEPFADRVVELEDGRVTADRRLSAAVQVTA